MSDMSDTDRMLAPQGLFQTQQPKPFDWQQPWSVPAAAPGQQRQGTSSTLPHGMDSMPPGPPAPYPPQQGNPYAQPGQYPPPGGYPPGAGFPPGGGYPPQPGNGYPYAPGQYPPDGGYGPGFPGRPPGSGQWDRIATRLKLPKGKLGPAIVAAVLLVIIIGAVALALPGGGNGSTPTGSATTTPPATSSAAAAANPAQKQAATRLSALLSQSANDHSDVNAAFTNVQACGKDLAKDAQIFTKSAANRRALLTKLAQLPGRSALPATMLADLTSGWQASATVDSDLAKWAAAAAGHCHKGNPKDPNFLASSKFEGPASTGKAGFAQLWNRLARRYGLNTVQADSL
jgi:hypothetical protein